MRRCTQGMKKPMHPRDEEEVPGASLDNPETGEEQVGEGVPNRTDPWLVERVPFSEQVDDLVHTPPIVFRVVQPGDL